MNRLKSSLTIITAALLCGTSPLLAQEHQRVSPHETTSTVVDGSRVTVTYGRPHSKDPKSGETRKIWGGLVPSDKVWRMGADESTLLVTEKPLAFGDTVVPAGAYSLFMLPAADGSAKLIVSKQLGGWGAYTYDEKQDLARVDFKKQAADKPADQLTIDIDKAGMLNLCWENIRYSAAFTVKK